MRVKITPKWHSSRSGLIVGGAFTTDCFHFKIAGLENYQHLYKYNRDIPEGEYLVLHKYGRKYTIINDKDEVYICDNSPREMEVIENG